MNNSKKPQAESQKSKLESGKTFEQQIIASARRLREKQDAQFDNNTEHRNAPFVKKPIDHSRWAWIATPAAAAIGLVIGLSINLSTKHDNLSPTPIVTDAQPIGQSIIDDGIDYTLCVTM